MAKLMLIGKAAEVELETDPVDGGVIATCRTHHYTRNSRHPGCGWTACYDDLNDGAEYAQGHADRGVNS